MPSPLRSARPHHSALEILESRIAPAAWVVNTLLDVMAADGLISFREAVTAAASNAAVHDAVAGSVDGDLITFDPSLSGTLSLLTPLFFGDDVVVDGAVDGGEVITFDFVDTGETILINTSAAPGTNQTVTFQHLEFTGGVTRTESPITLRSTGSPATEVVVNDVEFYNFVGADNGGVFSVDHSTLHLTEVYFGGNEINTNGVGGAIHAFNASTVTITDSEFDHNAAPAGGGGAIALAGGSSLSLLHVDFDDHSAGIGGAIYNDHSTVIYTGGTMSDNAADLGGAIYNASGLLTVQSVYFHSNSAVNFGGAIFTDTQSLSTDPADVVITGGAFHENTAVVSGGAIQSTSGIDITGVEFEGNHATAGFGYGGAISLLGNAKASIVRSTFSDNSAGLRGGAIFTEIGGFVHQITQSTFTDNSAGLMGGNAYLRGTGTVISNSTFAGGSAAFGGNIYAADTQLTLTSTIVADSSEDLARSNSVIHAQNSLIETAGAGIINGANTGNLFNVDPQLGSFGDHGGFTRTYSLLPGSPAIDAGSNPQGFDNDQRGTPFKRTDGAGTDIGAFEAPPAPVVTLLSGGKVAQFRDVDGDLVIVSTNAGTFSASDFFLISEGLGARFVHLDATHLVPGANVAIKAKRSAAGGDGFVNLSTFDAFGVSLGNVVIDGDVTDFYAGSDPSALGVRSLNVLSIGEFEGGGDIEIVGKLGALTVRTDIVESDLSASALTQLKVAGSILGADIDIEHDLVNGFVAGNVIGTDFFVGGDLGQITPNPAAPGKFRYLGGLTVKGSLLGADLGVGGDLSNLRISGDVQGTQVSVQGRDLTADLLGAQTVGNLVVGGRVGSSDFLIGYDLDLNFVNPNTLVEKVAVTGSWVSSNLAVGVERGADGFLGTLDDETITDANPIVSRIASITIKGTAYGTPGHSGDYYGIAAQEIVRAKIGLATVPLTAGAANNLTPIVFGVSFDFALHEVAAHVN